MTMKRVRSEVVARGTPKELIRAAEMRARMAARWRRSAGQGDATIRREILARFREVIDAESFGEYADETVMAAAQRAIEEVLGEGPARRPDR
jgi:hypothetical protein